MTTAADSYLAQVTADAKQTGIAHLGGEMDVPIDKGIYEAYRTAARIAEDCGYMAGYYNGCRSMLSITGPGLPGQVILDWYSAENQRVGCIRLLTETVAHLD